MLVCISTSRNIRLFTYKNCRSVLADGLTGEADAEFFEDFAVYLAGHHRGVHLAAVEEREAVEGAATVVVEEAQYRQGDQHFVGVQAGVAAVEHGDLGVLDGFDHFLRDEFHLVVDAGQVFECVEQQGGTGAEEVAGLGGDDGAVGQLDGCGWHALAVAAFLGGHCGAAVVGGDFGLLHEECNFADFVWGGLTDGAVAEGGVVAADNLVVGGVAADLVVADAEARHVDPHVGGRLVGVAPFGGVRTLRVAFAVDAFEDGVEDGEYLDVAVVVDGGLAVGFEVEGVDHVHVVEVGGGGLVGDVDGVLQGDAPDGEGLEFGVAGLDAALVLLVELAEAHGHLAAAGAWGGDDHQWARGLDVVVAAEALVAVDELHVGGVALDYIMVVGLDAHTLEALAIGRGTGLAVVVGDDDTGDEETALHENLAQAQHILVVGDAEVATFLVFLDVGGADDNHDLGIVLQLREHLQFAVGLKAWQHAAGVVVVEQLAAKFQIEFVAKLGDAFLDVLGLYPKVFLVVKTVFHKYTFFWLNCLVFNQLLII